MVSDKQLKVAAWLCLFYAIKLPCEHVQSKATRLIKKLLGNMKKMLLVQIDTIITNKYN